MPLTRSTIHLMEIILYVVVPILVQGYLRGQILIQLKSGFRHGPLQKIVSYILKMPISRIRYLIIKNWLN